MDSFNRNYQDDSDFMNIGINEDEESYIRLLSQTSLTHGTVVEINDTGTSVSIKSPGVIVGGSLPPITHDCSNCKRAVGYLIEGVIPLCLFAKKAMTTITFINCITEGSAKYGDLPVDVIRDVTLKLLTRFGVEGEMDLKIVKRGAFPLGGGEVTLTIPSVRTLKPIQWTDPGQIQSVRGVAYAIKVSPQFSNRMVDGIRGILNEFVADVYIHTNHSSGKSSGASPGYGVSLVAESTTKSLISISVTNNDMLYMMQNKSANEQDNTENENDNDDDGEEEEGSEDGFNPKKRSNSSRGADGNSSKSKKKQNTGISNAAITPEEVGTHAAKMLCEEISRNGVVDSSHQALVLQLMTLTTEDVSKVRFGKLTPFTISFLRFLKEAFGIVFKIVPDDSSIKLSCMGIGFINISKKVA